MLAEIRDKIQNHDAALVKKLSSTKSVFRLEVERVTVDVVYSKTTKQIITFLHPEGHHHEGFSSVEERDRHETGRSDGDDDVLQGSSVAD